MLQINMHLSLALIVAVLWALYPFILRSLKTHPIIIWFWMNCIAAMIGLLVCLLWKKTIYVQGGEFMRIALASFLGPACAFLIYFFLLVVLKTKTSVIIALAFTSPLFAVLIGKMWFGEHLKIQHIIGVLLTTLGVLLLVSA